jgi:hypothetical protein
MITPLEPNPGLFWFWTFLGTLFAGYTGFCFVLWWYTRSELSLLLSALAFWMFIITSSIGILQSGQTAIDPRCFLFLQRAAWLPALVTYWFIIDKVLDLHNGRAGALRHWWRVWQWRRRHES